RLSELHELGRQHRILPEELPGHLQALQAERQSLDRTDDDLESLTAELVEARAAFLGAAGRLGQARRAAATRLSATITEAMQRLGMNGGHFVVEVEAVGEDEAGSYGLDQVTFRVSANPGQPLQPLAKVASGGELSRISLAIQVATAACGRIPTLIYDEVDVGIGGRVAEIVGQLLKQVSAGRQVLCVTHLPQVACYADHHFQVAKQLREGQTFATITALDDTRRIEEIARMLGGLEITDTTRCHAREMRYKALC
ncbi:MAG: DNA repair protein RecN, partial [Pseudomonadota bacterium]